MSRNYVIKSGVIHRPNQMIEVVTTSASTTVSVVDKKYGANTSKTTEEEFQVAVDLVQMTYNMKDVGVKKLAKKIVKETGKNYVTIMLEDKEEQKFVSYN